MNEELTELKKKIKNEELFGLLETLVKSFLSALDRPFVPQYGSWYDRIKTLVEGSPDLIAGILLERKDLENEKIAKCLVDLKKSINFLSGKRDFSRKPPHASSKEDYKEELSFFLTKIFEERDRLIGEGFYTYEGIKRAFELILVNEYLKYEKYLYTNTVSDFIICPIENFVGLTKLDLGHNVLIREITQDEFHYLVEAEQKFVGQFPEYYSHIVISIPSTDPSEQTVSVITSLRLLQERKVGFTRIYRGYALPCRSWDFLKVPEESKFIRELDDDLYTFDKREMEAFAKLFSLLEKAKKVGYLVTAIRRFNFAYNRERLEDKWIDYFVSLESLYSTRSERGEVTHRISTRISKIMANSNETRIELRKKMKKWYRIRSEIVHGIQVFPSITEIQEIDHIVRESIKWFASHKDYANHTRIIDELDLGQ